MVLSNAFKGLILSWYVKIKFDSAIKSFHQLINKPQVEIYSKHVFEFIKIEQETPLIIELKRKNNQLMFKGSKFETGQAETGDSV